MGYGSGYSSKSDNGGKRFSNDMVAHTWNAGTIEAGQSNNGNMFFRGAAIYSYGTHFVIAYRMPDGVVFVNADSYSVSTSGHQSDVSRAIRDRRTFCVANLTELAGEWKLLPAFDRLAEKAELQTKTRHALAAHAVALATPMRAPGEYETAPDAIEAGAYLAKLAGLPDTAWPRIKREAAAKRAREAAAKAKAERDAAEKRALWFADMSAPRFVSWIAEMAAEYSYTLLVQTRKEAKRHRALMLAAKRGKLAAAGRLAIVRDRIKYLDRRIANFDAMRDHTQKRRLLRRHVATVKAFRDARDKSTSLTVYAMRDLAAAGEYLARFAPPVATLRASGAKLQSDAHDAGARIIAEDRRRAAEEMAERDRVNAMAREEYQRAWMAGEPIPRTFGRAFDAPTGGAALRIMGDTLETSHGAQVPLEHAIKAFRFIKLCRERGESFHRNGRTIRVGHFQVDSISASGDFVAGCHNFSWPEVERVAKLAGVFDEAPSAEAVISSYVAA